MAACYIVMLGLFASKIQKLEPALREAKQHFFYNTFNITHYVALNDRIVTE
jgi:hypothetical protein